jgi:hypothetical protein
MNVSTEKNVPASDTEVHKLGGLSVICFTCQNFQDTRHRSRQKKNTPEIESYVNIYQRLLPYLSKA